VASMAVAQSRATGLHAIDAAHLFAPNVTRLAVRRGAYLRTYIVDFIRQFAPALTSADIRNALGPGGQ
jgi:LysR family transcriptional regulator, cys regulon transcriptional activator